LLGLLYPDDFPDPDPCTEQVLFTGKPRDAESGPDYFGSRFYGNNLLRWTSPDQSSDVDDFDIAKIKTMLQGINEKQATENK